MNRASLDRYNDAALARAEEARLEPDEPDVISKCPKCGADLFVGDYVYRSVDGDMICESCFEDEALDHRVEVTEPEPDWDSMPGGYDYDG